ESRGMKFPLISSRRLKVLIALTVIVIILISLEVWTASAPGILTPQSENSVSGTLFQYAVAKSTLNITDGEGSYSFLFGLDYNQSVRPGIPSIVLVYTSMLTEQKTSGFLRGTNLAIDSAKVLIDGIEVLGVKSQVFSNDMILTDRLSDVAINETAGSHQITARLIVSTVDVNYIGYFGGNEEAISLNGTINVV
ncbi:MAG TPA: hypothetical protein VED17_07845, partial [Nitrososphaerales archaeon]|nr:hypothetical protein [Nitrososphaerales archaeon]